MKSVFVKYNEEATAELALIKKTLLDESNSAQVRREKEVIAESTVAIASIWSWVNNRAFALVYRAGRIHEFFGSERSVIINAIGRIVSPGTSREDATFGNRVLQYHTRLEDGFRLHIMREINRCLFIQNEAPGEDEARHALSMTNLRNAKESVLDLIFRQTPAMLFSYRQLMDFSNGHTIEDCNKRAAERLQMLTNYVFPCGRTHENIDYKKILADEMATKMNV